ncbi:MAG: hypothetical protein DMG26_16990 [Acidobacteria bacterium]|nr:MAG: hypothetical protein DMG26_16990 [Acidobacteriota bacterium]
MRRRDATPSGVHGYPFVDQVREMEIEVGKDGGSGKHDQEAGQQKRPLPARHAEDPRQPLTGT